MCCSEALEAQHQVAGQHLTISVVPKEGDTQGMNNMRSAFPKVCILSLARSASAVSPQPECPALQKTREAARLQLILQ